MLVFWILFNLFVLIMLALDLGVFNRRAHEVRFREALMWSAMVGVALLAADIGRLDSKTADRIVNATLSLGPLPKVDVRSSNIVKRLTADKKTRAGRVHFILPLEIGRVEVVDNIPETAVRKAVDDMRRLSLS